MNTKFFDIYKKCIMEQSSVVVPADPLGTWKDLGGNSIIAKDIPIFSSLTMDIYLSNIFEYPLYFKDETVWSNLTFSDIIKMLLSNKMKDLYKNELDNYYINDSSSFQNLSNLLSHYPELRTIKLQIDLIYHKGIPNEIYANTEYDWKRIDFSKIPGIDLLILDIETAPTVIDFNNAINNLAKEAQVYIQTGIKPPKKDIIPGDIRDITNNPDDSNTDNFNNDNIGNSNIDSNSSSGSSSTTGSFNNKPRFYLLESEYYEIIKLNRQIANNRYISQDIIAKFQKIENRVPVLEISSNGVSQANFNQARRGRPDYFGRPIPPDKLWIGTIATFLMANNAIRDEKKYNVLPMGLYCPVYPFTNQISKTNNSLRVYHHLNIPVYVAVLLNNTLQYISLRRFWDVGTKISPTTGEKKPIELYKKYWDKGPDAFNSIIPSETAMRFRGTITEDIEMQKIVKKVKLMLKKQHKK